MKYAFLVGGVGITVLPWAEPPDDPQERGARVEIQRLQEEPTPVFYAAQARSVRDPIFRADLFTRISGPDGNWEAAHYHPNFEAGWVPCERVWDPILSADPSGWMRGQLGDLRALLRAGGAGELAETIDQAEVDRALPLIVAAIEACQQPQV